jgi:hypothetical protein
MLVLAESGRTGKIQAEVKVNASSLLILEVNHQARFPKHKRFMVG